MVRYCTRCRMPGHRRNSNECHLRNLRPNVGSMQYTIGLVPREGPQRIWRVPFVFHHVVVMEDENGQLREYGFGPRGIQELPVGHYHQGHGRGQGPAVHRCDQTDLVINATQAQLRQVVREMRREEQWRRQNYCAVHNNCVSFCQEFLRRLYVLVYGRPLQNNRMPAFFRQYSNWHLNGLLNGVRWIAGQFGHVGPHNCVAF